MVDLSEIKLITRDNQWLKDFSFRWYSKLIVGNCPYWERYALTSYDQFVTMSLIKEINIKDNGIDTEAGYVIVPSFEQDILSSIYILPRYRKYGICTKVVNELNIKRLSCIAENKNAVRLYSSLGFKVIETNDPFKGSLKMERA